MNIKSQLTQVKGYLTNILSQRKYNSCDEEQLIYLIQYVDWLILDKLELNKDSLHVLMEEIVTTSVHQLNLDLLDCSNTLVDIEKEISNAKI